LLGDTRGENPVFPIISFSSLGDLLSLSLSLSRHGTELDMEVAQDDLQEVVLDTRSLNIRRVISGGEELKVSCCSFSFTSLSIFLSLF
jgi:hypothetical protein